MKERIAFVDYIRVLCHHHQTHFAAAGQLLDLESEEVILEAIDTDKLTRMAREFLTQQP